MRQKTWNFIKSLATPLQMRLTCSAGSLTESKRFFRTLNLFYSLRILDQTTSKISPFLDSKKRKTINLIIWWPVTIAKYCEISIFNSLQQRKMGIFMNVLSKCQHQALVEKAIEIRSNYIQNVWFTLSATKSNTVLLKRKDKMVLFYRRRAYVLEYFLM